MRDILHPEEPKPMTEDEINKALETAFGELTPDERFEIERENEAMGRGPEWQRQ